MRGNMKVMTNKTMELVKHGPSRALWCEIRVLEEAALFREDRLPRRVGKVRRSCAKGAIEAEDFFSTGYFVGKLIFRSTS